LFRSVDRTCLAGARSGEESLETAAGRPRPRFEGGLAGEGSHEEGVERRFCADGGGGGRAAAAAARMEVLAAEARGAPAIEGGAAAAGRFIAGPGFLVFEDGVGARAG